MAATRSAELALVRRFPALEGTLERLALCELPTPVLRAEKLEAAARTGPLLVKRDDLSAEPYGGNKPRKLEWLLGRALARGARRVLTFGGLGTNHGLATALYAGRRGLGCELVLVDQPIDASVRSKLLAAAAAGARLHYGRNVAGAALRGLALLARSPRTFVIPTGGSSPLGTLGFANAALELALQVEAGVLPAPARVYVAVGSGGSAAGLAAGLALAGLATEVVGVLVTDILPPDERRLRRLAQRALALLARSGARLPHAMPELRLSLVRGYVGAGYGSSTAEAASAVRSARELEGLELETTYTGKALAALLARERGRQEPIVFWNTYAGGLPPLPAVDLRSLPRPFRRLLAEPV